MLALGLEVECCAAALNVCALARRFPLPPPAAAATSCCRLPAMSALLTHMQALAASMAVLGCQVADKALTLPIRRLAALAAANLGDAERVRLKSRGLELRLACAALHSCALVSNGRCTEVSQSTFALAHSAGPLLASWCPGGAFATRLPAWVDCSAGLGLCRPWSWRRASTRSSWLRWPRPCESSSSHWRPRSG